MTRWQPMVWQAMACVTLLVAGAVALPARAQSVAEFYRGKTVNVLIGVGVGGEYDLQARLVARHIGKHIPGNPLVVPQNMTGAGGIKMAISCSRRRPATAPTSACSATTFRRRRRSAPRASNSMR